MNGKGTGYVSALHEPFDQGLDYESYVEIKKIVRVRVRHFLMKFEKYESPSSDFFNGK